jgi:hypothetical protein
MFLQVYSFEAGVLCVVVAVYEVPSYVTGMFWNQSVCLKEQLAQFSLFVSFSPFEQ